MIRSGSQNIINTENSQSASQDQIYQKYSLNMKNTNLSNRKNYEQTIDNTNNYSLANTNEISLHTSSMSSRIHNFRQKSLDFQMFHQHSPKMGLSINSERLSFQNNQVQHGYCLRHPNRKAKYFIIENSNHLFCSKCALGSALKGQKIEQIIASEERFRKAETDSFMENLKLTQHILQISDQENEKGKERVKEFYDKQLKTINEVFNNVENILVEERNKIVQKIHLTMCESLKQVDELKTKVKLFKFEIDQQERDITNHYDNIISEMENQPFTEILKRYSF